MGSGESRDKARRHAERARGAEQAPLGLGCQMRERGRLEVQRTALERRLGARHAEAGSPERRRRGRATRGAGDNKGCGTRWRQKSARREAEGAGEQSSRGAGRGGARQNRGGRGAARPRPAIYRRVRAATRRALGRGAST